MTKWQVVFEITVDGKTMDYCREQVIAKDEKEMWLKACSMAKQAGPNIEPKEYWRE